MNIEFKGTRTDSTQKIVETESKPPLSTKLGEMIRNVTVEPLIFIFMFAMGLQSVPMNNLMIDKICQVDMGLSDEICANVSNTHHETDVEKMSARFMTYNTYCDSVPAVIFSMFLGAWSDKYGRRPPIILSIFGSIAFFFMIIACAVVKNSSVYYLLIAHLFRGLCGGIVAFFIGAFSYLADITNDDNRTVRLAFADGFLLLGVPFGIFSSGLAFKLLGNVWTLVVSLILISIMLPMAFFLVKETGKATGTPSQMAKDFFSLENLKKSVTAYTKPRENNQRTTIILMAIAMCIYAFPFMGEGTIMYLFVRRKFHWTPADFSFIAAAGMILGFIALVIGIPLFTYKLKLSDAVLGIGGTVMRFVSSMLTCFAVAPWMLYLSAIPGVASPLINISIRSIISKSVSKEELGQLFALVVSFECLLPLVTSIIYPAIFSATTDTFPGAAFILSAVLLIPVHCIFWYIYIDAKRRNENKNSYNLENNTKKCDPN